VREKGPIFRLALTLAVALAVAGSAWRPPPPPNFCFFPQPQPAGGPASKCWVSVPHPPRQPLVLVGLNPQPLPPGAQDLQSLDLSTPSFPSSGTPGREPSSACSGIW